MYGGIKLNVIEEGSAESVEIKGAAHMTNIEDPEAFNQAITEFLGKHP